MCLEATTVSMLANGSARIPPWQLRKGEGLAHYIAAPTPIISWCATWLVLTLENVLCGSYHHCFFLERKLSHRDVE